MRRVLERHSNRSAFWWTSIRHSICRLTAVECCRTSVVKKRSFATIKKAIAGTENKLDNVVTNFSQLRPHMSRIWCRSCARVEAKCVCVGSIMRRVNYARIKRACNAIIITRGVITSTKKGIRHRPCDVFDSVATAVNNNITN